MQRVRAGADCHAGPPADDLLGELPLELVNDGPLAYVTRMQDFLDSAPHPVSYVRDHKRNRLCGDHFSGKLRDMTKKERQHTEATIALLIALKEVKFTLSKREFRRLLQPSLRELIQFHNSTEPRPDSA